MKTKLLLMLLASLAMSVMAVAAEITVLNPSFETRYDSGEFQNQVYGRNKYVKWGIDMWSQFECDNNGGPMRIYCTANGEPGDLVAPDGYMTVRMYTRYNDDLDAPNEGIRDFEALCQITSESFDKDKTYKLTAKFMHANLEYNGYALQLVAGGTHMGGATYGGWISGGTVIAQDYNTKTLAPGGTITSIVKYIPGSYVAEPEGPTIEELNGLPLQIRLCALEDPLFHGSTSYVHFDDVHLEGGGIVDLGPDMATWDGEGVTMAAEFIGYDGSASTYAWSVDPNDDTNPDPNLTVVIDDPTSATPTITATKINPIEVAKVTVKLSVDGGELKDTMVIYVYDDACGATRGAGLVSTSDLDADCDTDLADLAIMALSWLESTAATEAIPRT